MFFRGVEKRTTQGRVVRTGLSGIELFGPWRAASSGNGHWLIAASWALRKILCCVVRSTNELGITATFWNTETVSFPAKTEEVDAVEVWACV
jgi:hypothetical protein